MRLDSGACWAERFGRKPVHLDSSSARLRNAETAANPTNSTSRMDGIDVSRTSALVRPERESLQNVVKEPSGARPGRFANKRTLRERFCHGIATLSGWIPSAIYGFSFAWLPVLALGSIAGGMASGVSRLCGLGHENLYDDIRFSLVCGVPAILGSALALGAWVVTSPIALCLDVVDRLQGPAHKERKGLIASGLHAVVQGGYTGAMAWARAITPRGSGRLWEHIPTDVEQAHANNAAGG